jgi:hypothetical protein
MRRVRSDAGNQGAGAKEVPDLQEQDRAPDVARLIHPERQRMVRDRLRKEEHLRLGIRLSIIHGKTSNQRRDYVVDRFIEAGHRVKAGNRIQAVTVRIKTVEVQIVLRKINLSKSCRLIFSDSLPHRGGRVRVEDHCGAIVCCAAARRVGPAFVM